MGDLVVVGCARREVMLYIIVWIMAALVVNEAVLEAETQLKNVLKVSRQTLQLFTRNSSLMRKLMKKSLLTTILLGNQASYVL